MNHPIHDLDDVVHQRVRLGILATLIGSDTTENAVDFSTLCRGLDVTKGNLGQHLRMLEEAGYVAIDKAFENRRPRTRIAVTPHGRSAFAREGRALRRLLELAENPPPTNGIGNGTSNGGSAGASTGPGTSTVQSAAQVVPEPTRSPEDHIVPDPVA